MKVLFTFNRKVKMKIGKLKWRDIVWFLPWNYICVIHSYWPISMLIWWLILQFAQVSFPVGGIAGLRSFLCLFANFSLTWINQWMNMQINVYCFSITSLQVTLNRFLSQQKQILYCWISFTVDRRKSNRKQWLQNVYNLSFRSSQT